LGTTSGSSFGRLNVLAGLALVAWAGLALARQPGEHGPATLLLGLIAVVGGFCWRHRRYVPLFFNSVTAIRRPS